MTRHCSLCHKEGHNSQTCPDRSNKRKRDARDYVEVWLPIRDIAPMFSIHLSTGVGIHNLIRAACKLLAGSINKKETQELISEVIHNDDL